MLGFTPLALLLAPSDGAAAPARPPWFLRGPVTAITRATGGALGGLSGFALGAALTSCGDDECDGAPVRMISGVVLGTGLGLPLGAGADATLTKAQPAWAVVGTAAGVGVGFIIVDYRNEHRMTIEYGAVTRPAIILAAAAGGAGLGVIVAPPFLVDDAQQDQRGVRVAPLIGRSQVGVCATGRW